MYHFYGWDWVRAVGRHQRETHSYFGGPTETWAHWRYLGILTAQRDADDCVTPSYFVLGDACESSHCRESRGATMWSDSTAELEVVDCRHIQLLAQALELPVSGPQEDTRLMIEGKLMEMG